MARRPKNSRWRRLPGVYRFHEQTPDRSDEESRRLVLSLPAKLFDQAEAQARRAGIGSVQQYCEALLIREIEAERVREQVEDAEARRGRLEGLHAIANDPEYLAEWTASTRRARPAPSPDRPMISTPTPPLTASQLPALLSAPRPSPNASAPGAEVSEESVMAIVEGPAAEVVFRHAGVGTDDQSGMLPTLRRGESIGTDSARELLQALADLETQHRDAKTLDRRLAYALHKLAFEGQVLLTDVWAHTADETTVEILRLVQEGVDRVLSGEDIRYFARDQGPDLVE